MGSGGLEDFENFGKEVFDHFVQVVSAIPCKCLAGDLRFRFGPLKKPIELIPPEPPVAGLSWQNGAQGARARGFCAA